MEDFIDILQIGNFRIELKVHEGHGCSVVFTAMDSDNRRVIKAPVLENGEVKVYNSAEEAITDAMKRLGNFSLEV